MERTVPPKREMPVRFRPGGPTAVGPSALQVDDAAVAGSLGGPRSTSPTTPTLRSSAHWASEYPFPPNLPASLMPDALVKSAR